ncbi:ATP-binding protein [Streptomyces luteolifulvus]|uniref:ATP-binding protein n=1 Tax=Streptomyces luteolifulvus TaxID=2615112 RepID=UPI001CDA24E6|nr:ATP-binding protein [Streptomyces luteolifulvus]
MNATSYTSELELAAQVESVRWARSHTRDVLHAWQLPGEHIDTAQLVVSELVTNAVRHDSGQRNSTDEPRVTLTLHCEPAQLIVLVGDGNPNPPVSNGAVPLAAEGGRGLFIVEAVSKEWSYYFPPTGGKVVWCILALGSE